MLQSQQRKSFASCEYRRILSAVNDFRVTRCSSLATGCRCRIDYVDHHHPQSGALPFHTTDHVYRSTVQLHTRKNTVACVRVPFVPSWVSLDWRGWSACLCTYFAHLVVTVGIETAERLLHNVSPVVAQRDSESGQEVLDPGK